MDIKSIGKSIRARRLHMNLTQGNLAKKSGVRRGTIIDIEAGRPSNIATLQKIAEQLKGDILIVWAKLPTNNMNKL